MRVRVRGSCAAGACAHDPPETPDLSPQACRSTRGRSAVIWQPRIDGPAKQCAREPANWPIVFVTSLLDKSPKPWSHHGQSSSQSSRTSSQGGGMREGRVLGAGKMHGGSPSELTISSLAEVFENLDSLQTSILRRSQAAHGAGQPRTGVGGAEARLAGSLSGVACAGASQGGWRRGPATKGGRRGSQMARRGEEIDRRPI